MSELSPAARSVLKAAAASACLAEWEPLNDPPCHPDDEGWNGCHLCVKRDLIAAALRAAAALAFLWAGPLTGLAVYFIVIVAFISAITYHIE